MNSDKNTNFITKELSFLKQNYDVKTNIDESILNFNVIKSNLNLNNIDKKVKISPVMIRKDDYDGIEIMTDRFFSAFQYNDFELLKELLNADINKVLNFNQNENEIFKYAYQSKNKEKIKFLINVCNLKRDENLDSYILDKLEIQEMFQLRDGHNKCAPVLITESLQDKILKIRSKVLNQGSKKLIVNFLIDGIISKK